MIAEKQKDAKSSAKSCRIGPYALAIPAMQAGLAGYSDMAMRDRPYGKPSDG